MNKKILTTIFIGLVIAGGLLGIITYQLFTSMLSKEEVNLKQNLALRTGLLASTQTINANLLASSSATLTLEAWCKDHGLASDPKVIATPAVGAQKEISAAQRENLKISASEPVKYRQVKLSCGDKVLSEADNWYVPSRLTADMNTQLETTNTPFGKVVLSLQPSRKTLGVETLWEVLPKNWDTMKKDELFTWLKQQPAVTYEAERSLFQHQAIVSRSSDNLPISEVRETYKMALLGYFY